MEGVLVCRKPRRAVQGLRGLLRGLVTYGALLLIGFLAIPTGLLAGLIIGIRAAADRLLRGLE